MFCVIGLSATMLALRVPLVLGGFPPEAGRELYPLSPDFDVLSIDAEHVSAYKSWPCKHAK